MNITRAILPDRRLSAKWYNGQSPIAYLIFEQVDITVIEADAFNVPVFRQLQELTIENEVHLVEYSIGMFNGLAKLIEITLRETLDSLREWPANVLQPMQDHLRAFEYRGDIGTEPVLTNLFASVQLSSLRFFEIYCARYSLPRITADNFTGLVAIERFVLVDCGIEVIAKGTFDRMVNTLMKIDLLGNPFLRIETMHFRSFLRTRPRNTLLSRKGLILHWDDIEPYVCSMAFYVLRNATIISFKYDANDLRSMMCVDDVHELDDLALQQQIVHPQRWHLQHSKVWKYAFKKFHIHFMALHQQLTIMQANSDDYRLFFWSIDQKMWDKGNKCPGSTWIAANTLCRRHNRTVEIIRLPQFPAGSSIAACIIHISLRKESVPMHCITIHQEAAINFTFNWLHFGLCLLFEVTALIALLILIIVHCKKSIEPSII